MTPPKLSIIVPVLNEASGLALTLKPCFQPDVEVIVVDGGSRDSTVEVARSLGAIVLESPPGRAQQMNQGALIANSEILLFLHADTHLPAHFIELVVKTLALPNVIAGAFQLSIDAPDPGLRVIEFWANSRSRYLQMPYGDQAIFVRAQDFQAIGQFPELPIMEDFELIRRLRRQGKIAIVPVPVVTSARRWQKLGLWRTTLLNQWIVAAYRLGVSPDRLVLWYRGQHKT